VRAVESPTESPTADAPSANPLDQLSLRQLVVFVMRAHQRPLSELADLLGLSRETVHLDLRSAMRTLAERGAPVSERPTRRRAGRTGAQRSQN
jgi:DNA-directed RNA polymerase specialized sigma24 family protein